MTVHTLGYFYVQFGWASTKSYPLISRDTSREMTYPYRVGSCLVLRTPFSRRVVVLGVWTSQQDENTQLLKATGAQFLTLDEIEAQKVDLCSNDAPARQ